MRVLLDSSVVRAGFVSPTGASRALLRSALRRRVVPLVSTALLLEYEDVLSRQDTLLAAGLTAGNAENFLDDLCAACDRVVIRVGWRPVSPDPGDDLVLDAAINGVADAIASFDLRHLRTPAARFGIPGMVPADILRRL